MRKLLIAAALLTALAIPASAQINLSAGFAEMIPHQGGAVCNPIGITAGTTIGVNAGGTIGISC